MTDLLPWTWPDGAEVVVRWLLPLGEVRTERPSGAVLPYRMVNKIIGIRDGLVESGTYSIHTFAKTKPLAQAAGEDTDRRISYLANQFTGQQKVVMHDGTEVQADEVECTEVLHWEQWDAQNTIHRFVATYRIKLRLISAT